MTAQQLRQKARRASLSLYFVNLEPALMLLRGAAR